MTTGLVFDIQRFSIHDGPGIRTTVFLKGCPLACLWCHNPESQSAQPEIFYTPDKCIGCTYCQRACEQGCHHFDEGRHTYVRDKCTRCGKCCLECYPKALELVGKTMTVDEVMAEVLRDAVYYRTSEGGVTLSGGEPMAQFEFTVALLAAARQAGLHTCMETSGCSTPARFAEVQPLTDLFYYDIKETDPARHLKYTGVPLEPIIQNARALDAAGAELVLRCPVIPGLNGRADHFKAIADLADSLNHVTEVHILPYHPLGTSKNARLGKAQPSAASSGMPDDAQAQAWVDAVQKLTRVKVRRD